MQNWLHSRYPSVSFVVTENGWGNESSTATEDLNDIARCNYHRSYIGNMSKNAADKGLSVLGYYAWCVARCWPPAHV